MITEITGAAGSGKSSRIYNLVGESLSRGRSVFLVVPEQTAVNAERRLSVYCAERGIPTAELEIVSFRRLANRVFREYGGLSYRYIGPGGKAVIAWRVLCQVGDALRHWRGVSLSDISTINAMCAQLDELRSSGISPSVLEKAAAALGDGALADKLSDLALISSAYGALLSADYDDPKEDITRLADLLEEHDFFRGKDVFLDSFYGFTPDEYRVIGRIMRTADNLTVALQEAGESSAFHDSALDTERRLRRLIPDGERLHTERLGAADGNARAPVLRELTARLCSGIGGAPLTPGDCIRLYSCRDRYEEAEAAAAEILSHVRGGGRFSDCSVIVRRTSDWLGIADAVFARHGIPCFISQRSDVTKAPAVRLITASLEAVGRGWRTEDITEILKTGLTPLTDEECDILEIYADSWHIHGRRWYDEYEWNMNPGGYSDRLSEEDAYILSTANSAREKLAPPLMLLDLGKATVGEYCRAVYSYLLALDLPARLAATGEEEPVMLWNAVIDSLDILSSVASELTVSADTMAKLFRVSLSGVTVGRIPTCVDEVTVGGADLYRPDGCKVAILLGCSDGEFPSVPTETGLLSDRDRERLGELGIDIGKDPAAALSEEYLYFYMALSAPTQRLVLSRHTQSESGTVCPPSEGWNDILAMLKDCTPVVYSALLPSERVFSSASALDWALGDDGESAMFLCGTELSSIPEFAARLESRGGAVSISGAEIGRALAEAIYGDTVNMSNSMIEAYSGCAFAYFGKYVLGLSEPGGAVFRAADVGNYIHGILERFVSEVSLGNLSLEEPGEGEYERFIEAESIRYEQGILRGAEPDARQKNLFRRLRRTARLIVADIADEMRHSDFRPSFFELPFGEGEALPPVSVKADGVTAKLCGRIDRVDLCRRGDELLVKVTDYKTGAIPDLAASPASGKGMQLLIYLTALCRDSDRLRRLLEEGYASHPCNGESAPETPATSVVPAAAFYTEVHTPSESAGGITDDEEKCMSLARDSIHRRGIMLDDPKVAAALDSTGEGHFIPARVKRDGSLSDRSGSLLTAEDIGAKCEEASDAVRRTANGIISGRVDASPLRTGYGRTACDCCVMRAVCRNCDPRIRRPAQPVSAKRKADNNRGKGGKGQ